MATPWAAAGDNGDAHLNRLAHRSLEFNGGRSRSGMMPSPFGRGSPPLPKERENFFHGPANSYRSRAATGRFERHWRAAIELHDAALTCSTARRDDRLAGCEEIRMQSASVVVAGDMTDSSARRARCGPRQLGARHPHNNAASPPTALCRR
jgi:hypothetical protein